VSEAGEMAKRDALAGGSRTFGAQERMMTRGFITFLVGLTAACMLLILEGPTAAKAQGRSRGRAYTKSDVDRIIKRVEQRSDSFKDVVDRSLDRSVLDGTRREDNINEQVKQFEKALDALRSDFDREDRWLETRRQVERVLDEAEEVNTLIRRHSLRQYLERGWALLRSDLNRLAGIYDLPRLKA
jgi:exonuclease VII large subunit